MVFPRIMFGRCPVCGGKGGDNADPNADGGSHFATGDLDTEGNGYELVMYQGDWMCRLCKKRLMSESESDVMSASYRRDKEFLHRAGFKDTI